MPPKKRARLTRTKGEAAKQRAARGGNLKRPLHNAESPTLERTTTPPLPTPKDQLPALPAAAPVSQFPCDDLREDEGARRQRLAILSEQARFRRENESADQRRNRLKQMSERQHQRSECENDAQRTERLAQKAHTERQRRENATEEERVERLAQQAIYERQCRDSETNAQRTERLAQKAHTERQRRENATEVERVERLAQQAIYERQCRDSETNAQRTERLAQKAHTERQRRENATEVERVERLAQQAIYERQCRDSETNAQRTERLAQKANSDRKRRAEASDEVRLERLAQKIVQNRTRKETETASEHDQRVAAVREQMRRRRGAEARERLEAADAEAAQRAEEAEREQSQQLELSAADEPIEPDLAPVDLVATHLVAARQDVAEVVQYYVGNPDEVCSFCQAMHFKGETPADRLFRTCCQKGNVVIEPLLPYPRLLFELLTGVHSDSKNFRANVRSYNSSLSFASVGAKTEVPQGRGTYCFRVHGNIQHIIGHLGSSVQKPLYSHLYFLDAEQARAQRLGRSENAKLRPGLLFELDALIRQVNPFAKGLKMLGQVEAEERVCAIAEGRSEVIAELRFVEDRRRTFENPTAHEVAVVYQSVDGGMPPLGRDIRIHTRDGFFEQLSVLSPNTDPLSYALIFPRGEPGWQTGMPHTRQSAHNSITLMEFYGFRLHDRLGQFNPVLHAGKLTQQFMVDAYIKVEGNRLEFVIKNQRTLRAELYRGLMDHLENRAEQRGYDVGKMVILPSSFIGSPRHCQQLYQDAMSIVTKFGKPDLFVTVTCNPKWPEIQDNLAVFERAEDRPDLTARVFQLKLRELMGDITKRHVLGVPLAHFHVVEFQKRGLPHAHILIILRDEDKIRTPEQVDALISAELPDPMTDKRLHEIIVASMVHGPCGARKPNSVCMEEGKCKKRYPKSFAQETVVNDGGFTIYRRRDNSRTHTMPRNVVVDNRDIVPYNRYLSSKFNCHLNVEHCGSAKTVKYLCKYVHKGHDCARVELRVSVRAEMDQGVAHEGRKELIWDEVSNYIDTRYVSPQEAVWRIFGFDMHDKSHTVIRLAIHLEGEHTVTFRPGDEEAAAERAQTALSTLMAWFVLNSCQPEARVHKYIDIPYYFVFSRTPSGNAWRPRKRGASSIISRMYSVTPRQIERYHLRLLLLHVTGATCYKDVRTHRGVVYNTFKEAAIARNLLMDDDEWERCLEEAVKIQMPNQLRQLFAVICAFCGPVNPLMLWEKYKGDFCEDFARDNDPIEAEQMALNAVQAVLSLHRLTNVDLGLPAPRVPVIVPVDEQFDQTTERMEAEENMAKLNDRQREAFDVVMAAIDDPDAEQRCFYLDGPGGSGKTFVYNTLISALRARGDRAVAVAWTGIAATLLKGGRTCHSRFRLPVPIVENSTSGVKPNSVEGAALRAAKVIILDEGPMAPVLALNAIDRTLRDVARDDRPFGGKVIVIGGDFRQCLPVVRNGNRTTIVEQCIKRSALWPLFRTLELRANMRANDGEVEFVQWLLRVGNGELLNDHNLPDDTIALPQECVVDSVMDAVFGKSISPAEMAEMRDYSILCPKNTESLNINDTVLERLEGQVHEYCSADSVDFADGEDGDALVTDYPVEYLNSLTPSGMPPHKLRLKVHAIVMLLRNVNVRAGLCNGTRLSVVALHEHVIDCMIIGGRCDGERAFLSRVNLTPSDIGMPFTFTRRQFPIRLAFAMTINKAQGQSLRRVGVHLEKPVFGHGQLYVALSRARSMDSVFLTVTSNEAQGKLIANCNTTFTKNVVFKEVLETHELQQPSTALPQLGVSRSDLQEAFQQAVEQSLSQLTVSDSGELNEDADRMDIDCCVESCVGIVRASFNQGDSRFSNAGKQCTAMAACALALAHSVCPSTWRTATLDRILEAGDNLYSLSASNLPTGEEFLTVQELRDCFSVAGLKTWISNSSIPGFAVHGLLWPQNLPHDARRDAWPDILTGLGSFLESSACGILTAVSVSVAIGRTADGMYWLFDSHSRNQQGFVCANGKACLAINPDLTVLSETFVKNVFSANALEPKQYSIERLDIVRQIRK